MTKDEALTQALDALERSPWKNWRTDKAIDAINQALAQPEQYKEANYDSLINSVKKQPTDEADQLLVALHLDPNTYRTDGGWLNIPKIVAAIKNPQDYPHLEQEPVGYEFRWTNPAADPCASPDEVAWKPLATGAFQTTQQHIKDLMAYRYGGVPVYEVRALYTATPQPVQPQRQWVGLTRREFEEATSGLEDLEDCWMAIEAKLRERNE